MKLLSHLTDAELRDLLGFGEERIYEPHANVVIEGETSWGLYLILDGYVGILKTNKLTGDVYDIGQLHQGSYFGEMSLVDEGPRSATVRALTRCHLYYIDKEKFMKWLAQSNDRRQRFLSDCIADLITRLRELDDSYVINQYQLWRTAVGHAKILTDIMSKTQPSVATQAAKKEAA
ncbi:MAG: cyclic nucleotide-binding domain-containing protein [Bdellovibrionales bacterium]|nr:cyclic nucleotide-binding domain-containing protein [Bdellovibrionales bacterium]